MNWQPELDELRAREAMARRMGGADKVRRQHDGGRLTIRERIDALVAIRDLHRRHGHIQEVIIQNFRAKPGTRMANHPEPSLDDHLWTISPCAADQPTPRSRKSR